MSALFLLLLHIAALALATVLPFLRPFAPVYRVLRTLLPRRIVRMVDGIVDAVFKPVPAQSRIAYRTQGLPSTESPADTSQPPHPATRPDTRDLLHLTNVRDLLRRELHIAANDRHPHTVAVVRDALDVVEQGLDAGAESENGYAPGQGLCWRERRQSGAGSERKVWAR